MIKADVKDNLIRFVMMFFSVYKFYSFLLPLLPLLVVLLLLLVWFWFLCFFILSVSSSTFFCTKDFSRSAKINTKKAFWSDTHTHMYTHTCSYSHWILECNNRYFIISIPLPRSFSLSIFSKALCSCSCSVFVYRSFDFR